MNKVYVVSYGDDSDYHVVRVFLSEEKAKQYHSMIKNNAFYDVEEFELSDDKIIQPINYFEMKYYMKDSVYHNKGEYEFHINKSNDLDDTTESINDGWCSSNELRIKRVIPSVVFNERDIKDKYLKICQNVSIRLLWEMNKGVSEKDIQKIIDEIE